MDTPYQATDDIAVLPATNPVPGLGYVPTHAFLMSGRDPILIDTGPATERDAFLTCLSERVDPARLSWVFLTHEDRDHSGNLQELLRLAPRARVVTSYFALPKLALDGGVPVDRVRIVAPGDLFTANGRTWRVLRPPVFDAPSTVGFFDREEANLFAADCFGALLPEPTEFANEIARDKLSEGMAFFARATAAWLPLVDPDKFDEAVDIVRQLAPVTILSSHGPVFRDMSAWACDVLGALPGMEPLPRVDDLLFRQMLDVGRRAA